MKRIVLIFCTGFLCTILGAEPGDRMFVSVPNASLFEKKSALSAAKSKTEYGQEVVVIREEKNWRLVQKLEGGSGWIPLSALSFSPILKGETEIEESELRFAGKNFAAEDESAYRTSGKANYDAVDAMEKSSLSESELREFLAEGSLKAE